MFLSVCERLTSCVLPAPSTGDPLLSSPPQETPDVLLSGFPVPCSWWDTMRVMRASAHCLLSDLTLDSPLKLKTQFSPLVSVSCQKTVLWLSQQFPCVPVNSKQHTGHSVWWHLSDWICIPVCCLLCDLEKSQEEQKS